MVVLHVHLAYLMITSFHPLCTPGKHHLPCSLSPFSFNFQLLLSHEKLALLYSIIFDHFIEPSVVQADAEYFMLLID